jgi:hypothetical protein
MVRRNAFANEPSTVPAWLVVAGILVVLGLAISGALSTRPALLR